MLKTRSDRGFKTSLVRVMAAALPIALSQDATFHTTVPAVLVPATVVDSKGRYIDSLSAEDFTVLDNGIEQRVRLDTADNTTIPLAVVFAIQADDVATAAILKIRKIGSTIQPLITGERGHAAVLTYGSKVTLVEDFTSDLEDLSRAFAGIKPEDDRAAPMLDAVANAVSMLHFRPANERRIVVVIGESRDRGSKATLDEVVKLVQRESVTVFSAVYSAYLTPFTTKARDLPAPNGQGGLLAS